MLRHSPLIIALFLVVSAAAGGGWVYWIATESQPRYSGELALRGIQQPVLVRYGPHAVPSIQADALADAMFAQGYVVASERMWQMDLMRRLAGGRLAEVFGQDALKADRFFRTIGLAAAARHGYAELDARYREILDAYTAGVNAYQQRAKGRPPLEYRIAGFEPSPWRSEDSLAIGEYMAWTLSFNLRQELSFLRLAQRLGNERAPELFPTDQGIPAPSDAEQLPPFSRALTVELGAMFALPAQWGLVEPGPASNGWAITGERTQSGEALLANDPHLAPSMPGLWYELEITAPDYHVAGVTLPGVPMVLIGHNELLAWGFTTVMADTQDLFVERIMPDGANVERPDGGSEPIRKRTQRIDVRGWNKPFEQVIRATSNGVILNDILGHASGSPMDLPAMNTHHLLALQWNIEVPGKALEAIYRLNTAATVDQARRAALSFRHTSQNVMLAHRDGSIGWQVSGMLPKRGRGSGTFPSPGWLKGFGWAGYVPQDKNPGIADPPGQMLITANNRTIPQDYQVDVGHSWMAPYRAQRIEALLEASGIFTANTMATMQMDRVSTQPLVYQDALHRVRDRLLDLDPEAWQIASELLLDWDADLAPDSRSAAFFVLLEAAMYQALLGDELEDDLKLYMQLATVTYSGVDEAVRSGVSSFWDDVGTPEIEDEAEVWAKALRLAWERMQQELPNRKDQRLDRLRELRFPHAFDRQPVLGALFSVGPIGVGGSSHTINVMKAAPDAPRHAKFTPSLRVVYTPADWSATRGTLPLGQSGHRFSPYRTDQLEDWLNGAMHRWPWGGPEQGTELGTLRLVPGSH